MLIVDAIIVIPKTLVSADVGELFEVARLGIMPVETSLVVRIEQEAVSPGAGNDEVEPLPPGVVILVVVSGVVDRPAELQQRVVPNVPPTQVPVVRRVIGPLVDVSPATHVRLGAATSEIRAKLLVASDNRTVPVDISVGAVAIRFGVVPRCRISAKCALDTSIPVFVNRQIPDICLAPVKDAIRRLRKFVGFYLSRPTNAK